MRASEEEATQCAFVEWVFYQYPVLYPLLWHTPNGGRRGIAEAIRFKKMGVKSGVPDLFLAVPRGIFHGLFIEMKSAKGKISDNQKFMMEQLRSQGYMVAICRGIEDAQKTLRNYLDGYGRN